ncbi:MAG: glycosyltransferase [Firmicutes bacterium]|nr:glycosyltransferase [Bacillota bacterium]
MKILLINHFPLAGSGSGTYTKNLAVSLARLGIQVTVILPENTEDFTPVPGIRLVPVYFTPEDGSEAPEGALPFNFPCFTTHPRSTKNFGEMSDQELEAYIGAFTAAIKKEVSENRPDVIHGQHIWILSSLAAGLGVPLVLTAHGTDLIGYERWPELRHFADRAIAASDRVIAISKDNLALVKTTFPSQTEKVSMMRNGYDTGVFHPLDLDGAEILAPFGIGEKDLSGRKVIIFAGKLTHAKGVDVLLKAAKIYEQKRDDVLTIIAGDGEEMADLRSLSEELGLERLRFLGNVDQTTLNRLYNISDLDLVPSRKEAFGLVAIEAMACGIPVIASDVGGLPDFVNSEVGALVKSEDPEALAEAILSMLSRLEGPGTAEWKDSISSYAEDNYAQDTIIRDLEELYAGLI